MVLSRDISLLIVAAVILIIQGYRPFPPACWERPRRFLKSVWCFSWCCSRHTRYERIANFAQFLVYVVAVFVPVSGFHYAITVARRLHAS